MQNHYQKKFATKFLKHIFTLSFNEFVSFVFNEIVLFLKSLVILLFISLFTSSFTSSTTFFILFLMLSIILFIFILFAISRATSKKSIFWAKIISKSIISSKSSRLSFSILEFLKSALITFSIFSSTFLSSTRFYITMNNLFVMFIEKFKSINLMHRQKNEFFSYNKQFNKLVIFY